MRNYIFIGAVSAIAMYVSMALVGAFILSRDYNGMCTAGFSDQSCSYGGYVNHKMIWWTLFIVPYFLYLPVLLLVGIVAGYLTEKQHASVLCVYFANAIATIVVLVLRLVDFGRIIYHG